MGSTTVNLSNLVFEGGIDFDFREHSSIFELDPGERVLLVNDLPAFEFRYGSDLPVAGVFQNATGLSNGGETLTMTHGATGAVIQSFSYEDSAPWPEAADGHGYSLTLAHPGGSLSDPRNWRASREAGGTPGTGDRVSLAGWLADGDACHR